MRLLYSFPFRIGAGRICTTAWHQVTGVADAGVHVFASVASQARPLPATVTVAKTLTIGSLRVPYRLIGARRACNYHDWRTARWLRRNRASIDLVHGWPTASLRTLRTAQELGIPTVIERPNAHTALAFAESERESRTVGIELAPDHDHYAEPQVLALEEREYAAADHLLCPSRFVELSFLDRGFPAGKLIRHRYGFDEARFHPGEQTPSSDAGLTVLYVGACEPRKGLHYIVEAWRNSPARQTGRLRICGAFVPHYRERIAHMLDDPSIEVLGHRTDVPDLMRHADVFVLSSVEEGSALVTYEARGAGCVLAVSDATGAVATHMVDALVHSARDVGALTQHLTLLHQDRALLHGLRSASLAGRDQLTWAGAGRHLASIYKSIVARRASPS